MRDWTNQTTPERSISKIFGEPGYMEICKLLKKFLSGLETGDSGEWSTEIGNYVFFVDYRAYFDRYEVSCPFLSENGTEVIKEWLSWSFEEGMPEIKHKYDECWPNILEE